MPYKAKSKPICLNFKGGNMHFASPHRITRSERREIKRQKKLRIKKARKHFGKEIEDGEKAG
jgi:hypothetical protein